MDSSIHHLERLVMASASWQSWAMSVRAVYRWEDPRTTVKWLLVYVVIWYMQHTMGFLVSGPIGLLRPDIDVPCSIATSFTLCSGIAISLPLRSRF